ncbi:hypothetical protein [Bradyrhizobium sp. 62]|uniref:hypothetical protein n=1 Tax=Bradyrhizobium sp. 62 TaxID=1043588 RepID=UPI001FFB1834|nr:hypothetical protein [Bradyrhizobium sp. 62]MCK1363515.1 hypothetical protein [Bradyrhizobium sp. 62]
MPKCLLCFSENVYEITDDQDSEWTCSDCGAFGATEDDISSPAIDLDQGYRNGQVERVLTDDPEDVYVPGWA